MLPFLNRPSVNSKDASRGNSISGINLEIIQNFIDSGFENSSLVIRLLKSDLTGNSHLLF